ncbi:MAG: hypothetical protein JXQ79_02910 [Rhodobacteraceae bacterium]|nr:hypothetical protein [Paracoccaceae bacterium]
MSDIPTAQPFGWAAFGSGAAALILVIAIFWAGPFAPQQPVGLSLGEMAAEIAKSAARAAAGQEARPPLPVSHDLDDYLNVATGILAGLAVIFGCLSFVRHEAKRAALSGIALGGLAIGFQLFAWTIMMIVGALMIASVVYAMRDVFNDTFGGLFGG